MSKAFEKYIAQHSLPFGSAYESEVKLAIEWSLLHAAEIAEETEFMAFDAYGDVYEVIGNADIAAAIRKEAHE